MSTEEQKDLYKKISSAVMKAAKIHKIEEADKVQDGKNISFIFLHTYLFQQKKNRSFLDIWGSPFCKSLVTFRQTFATF